MEESEKDKRVKNRENKDTSVQEQIAVEAQKRENREKFKESEKSKMTKILEKDEKFKKTLKNVEIPKSKEINFGDVKKEVPKHAVNIRRSKLPPPRQRNKIKVTFTERVFPTPIRESNIPEEQARVYEIY